MDTDRDHYGVLGVLPSIDDVAIAAVCRALLKRYHPDVFCGSKTEAEKRTRGIIEAYEVLGNPENRKAYDDARKAKGFRSYQYEEQATRSSDDAPVDWDVNKKTIYKKLIQVLLRSGFRLQARDLSQGNISTDRGMLSSLIGRITEPVPPVFNPVAVQQLMDKVREWAAMVCIKYFLDQPIMVAVVDADRLTHEEAIKLSDQLDETLLPMLDFTGGLTLNNKSVKFCAFGFILFVFSDHALALAFIERAQRKCKIWQFGKKTVVYPWVVDVPNRTVSSHRGLPLAFGALNWHYLQKELFQ